MTRRQVSHKRPSKFLEQCPTDYGLPTSERWLLTTRPLPGESLASWFSRQASVMGSDARQLASLIADHASCTPDTLCRDLDAVASDPLLIHLSECTGICLSNVTQMPAIRILGGSKPRLRFVRRWALRYRLVDAIQPVTQICPECLAGDETPYLRRNWRLGWFVGCEKHQRPLLDTCPSCGHGFVATAVAVQRLLNRECPACGTGLHEVGQAGTGIAPEVLALQGAIQLALTNGYWAPRPGFRSNAAGLLGMIDKLFPFLVAKSLGRDDSLFTIRDRSALTAPDRHVRTPAGASVALRHDVLRIVALLLQDWPLRMMKIADQMDFPAPWNPWKACRLFTEREYLVREQREFGINLFEKLGLPLEIVPVPRKQGIRRPRKTVPIERLRALLGINSNQL